MTYTFTQFVLPFDGELACEWVFETHRNHELPPEDTDGAELPF